MSDAKKAILARRAKFVAAAVAGIAVGCGKEPAPQPCLEVTASDDAGAPPQPCLSPPPQPCLSVYNPPPDPPPDAGPAPRPCLSIARPKTNKDGGPCTCQPNDPLCSCK